MITLEDTRQHTIWLLIQSCMNFLHPVICSIACQVATSLHNYLLEEKFCLDLNSALVFLAVECFDSVELFTETIPFFSNDVTSTFEPLVGA